MFVATTLVVACKAVAKGFNNDLGSWKSMVFLEMTFIVAQEMSLQFLQPLLQRKKIAPKPFTFLATTLIVVKYRFFTT